MASSLFPLPSGERVRVRGFMGDPEIRLSPAPLTPTLSPAGRG
ncbi:hypothetical protein [Azospirillum argentinense]